MLYIILAFFGVLVTCNTWCQNIISFSLAVINIVWRSLEIRSHRNARSLTIPPQGYLITSLMHNRAKVIKATSPSQRPYSIKAFSAKEGAVRSSKLHFNQTVTTPESVMSSIYEL